MKKIITGNLVRFTFDGDLPAIEFDCTKLSENNKAYAVLFGMSHRLGDMAAIPKSEANNFTVTELMRRDAIAVGVEHYNNPAAEWNMKPGKIIAQNPTWLAIAVKRGVEYSVIAGEKAAADLAELAAM